MRQKNKKRIRIAILAAAAVFGINTAGLSVNAAAIPYAVEYEYSASKVYISGTLAEEGEIVFQVLNQGKSFGDISAEDILYHRQKTATDGAWSFEMEYGNELGDYSAVLVTNNIEERTPLTLGLVSEEAFAGAYEELNQAAKDGDMTAFADLVNTKRNMLNLRFSLTDGKTLSSSQLTGFMSYVAANPMSVEQEKKNVQVFKTYMTAYELNRSGIANIADYIDQLYIADEAIYNNYRDLADSGNVQKYFTGKLSGGTINDLDSFEKAFKRALVYTTILYGSGYGEAKDALQIYGDTVGITGTAADSVYRGLIGRDFADDSALRSAYNKLLIDVKNKENSGNRGGSGGGGGSAGSLKGEYTMDYLPADRITETIAMTFNDIDGVDWAVEAILALADKGIINGTAPNRFDPDRNVTREEFAKILIGAMNLSDYAYSGNVFTDVPNDEWYCRYVNIAYENKILNGVGDGEFGVGQTITREDMSTMIYNALKMRGVALGNRELTFEDSADISGYAQTAVSALYELGAVNGVSETEFQPKGQATRAQAAKIVYGVLDYLQ